MKKAIALVTDIVLNNPLGKALGDCCKMCGIKLDTHSVTKGCANYTRLFREYDNVITWNCRMRHNWKVAQGKNVLYVENSLLSQRSGMFIDANGFFSHSNMRLEQHWSDMDYDEHAEVIMPFLRAKFGWEPFSGSDPDGPIIAVLQNAVDCNMVNEFPFGAERGGDRLLASLEFLHTYLPQDRKVLLRPHPRFLDWWKKHEAEYKAKYWRGNWELNVGGRVYALLPKCSAMVAVNSTTVSEAISLGMPVAVMGTGNFTDSGAVLDCSSNPEALKGLLSYQPDVEACKAYIAAVFLKHHVSYDATAKDLLKNGEFRRWIERTNRVSGGLALAPVDWVAKEQEARNPLTAGMLEKLRRAELVPLPETPLEHADVCSQESRRTDLGRYPVESIGEEGIVIGYFGTAKPEECLFTTTLPRKLREKYGCRVRVVTHRNTKALFKNNPYVEAHYCKGRVAVGRQNLGMGHHVQRVERFFGLPEDDEPKPDVYLSKSEQRWAETIKEALPNKPVVALCCWGGNDLPWQRWADVLAEEAVVLQLSVGTNPPPPLKGHMAMLNLPLRQFLAVVSIVDGYVGSEGFGAHAAAAFNVPALVVLGGHDESPLLFPTADRKAQHLYPQHQFGRYVPVVEGPIDGLSVERMVSSEFNRIKEEIEASTDTEMKGILAQHVEQIEEMPCEPEVRDDARQTIVRAWRSKQGALDIPTDDLQALQQINDVNLKAFLLGAIDEATFRRRMRGNEPFEFRDGRLVVIGGDAYKQRVMQRNREAADRQREQEDGGSSEMSAEEREMLGYNIKGSCNEIQRVFNGVAHEIRRSDNEVMKKVLEDHMRLIEKNKVFRGCQKTARRKKLIARWHREKKAAAAK